MFKRVLAIMAILGLLTAMLPASAAAVVAGAGFTTFVAGDEADCNDSPNGINCNNYADKESVYMSGGPSAAGLSDGTYYFAVLTPGSQNGGAADGSTGNLSDTTFGGTSGDLGSGDLAANRTFTVTSQEITVYGGTHATGYSPNGRYIIGLAPFDDTDNPGGVYILAICEVGSADPADCKYDAFRIQDGGTVTNFGVVSGLKYYDANVNGQFDAGEVGIPNWPIDWTDGLSGTVYTDANGEFSLQMVADTYTFAEQQAGAPWIQTGNTVDQATSSGGNSDSLLNFVYTVSVVDNGQTSGLNFGNVCVGAGGGHTLGFWSNKNGQATMNDGGTLAPELALLSSLNLRKANGDPFDPANYAAFRTWLLNASATNMAYMLSAQLAAMALNVEAGFVSGTALVWDGTSFVTINALMAAANTSLGADGNTPAGDPNRATQEALKNTLDAANNNLNFLQPGPSSCPTAVFD